MIVNIGVDTIEVSRVQKACARDHFLNKVFSPRERQQMDGKMRRAASDFAGKEAVAKVFGTGFSEGIEAGQIEILRGEKGEPYIVLNGRAKEMAAELGIDTWKISITNTKDVATAFVIGLRRDV